MHPNTTRRTVLKGIGATAATTGTVGTASGDTHRTSTRFAVFNIIEFETEQVQEKGDEQAEYAARIIQKIRPDVIAINELTNNLQEGTATDTANVRAFVDNYLAEPQGPNLDGIRYPFTFQPKSNTGVLPPEEYDFNKDGEEGERPDDAYGFGEYPGHYAFAIASRYPILEDEIRTFREFLWADMPENLMPVDDGSMEIDKSDGSLWATEAEADVRRLSSKNHVDVPIRVDGDVIHGLVAHPTPPGFDGENDFNDRWNHDEVRFLADYVAGADYIYDDDGNEGGLDEDASYVLMGDLNAGPETDRVMNPSKPFLFENDDFYTDELPTSPGGAENGNAYATRSGGDFDGVVEQIDYVLPSPDLTYVDGAVVWPSEDGNRSAFAEVVAETSDHRMVWADVTHERDRSGGMCGWIRSILEDFVESSASTPGRGAD